MRKLDVGGALSSVEGRKTGSSSSPNEAQSPWSGARSPGFRNGEYVTIIQCISDLHGYNVLLNPSADYIFLLGDIHGLFFWQLKDFLFDNPEKQNHIFGILGNHDDVSYEWNYPWVKWMHTGDTVLLDNGMIAGFLPWEESTKTVAFVRLPDIIFSHASVVQKESPPDKDHQAVRAYKDYLESNAPKLWFQGHIHESFELEYKTTTVCSVYRSLDYSLEGR